MNKKEDFISLEHVHKNFAGVHALKDLSLSIKKGEIHCLAGENGSGKSTLIKVISGIHVPSEGVIRIGDKILNRLTPKQAIALGVQVIYQDFSLFANLTVAENLALNTNLAQNKKLVSWKKVYQLAREAMDRLQIDIDLKREVGTLPVAQKQLIAIARALMFNARLIIMDEPTTALTGKEVQVLFDIVRQIQKEGISVLFVSHKMREMLEISEKITVIRNGSKVAEGPTTDFDEKLLTYHMTGQEFTDEKYIITTESNETPRLQLGNYCGNGFQNIDLCLHKKEVIGITGLLGSGRTEFAKALFGMQADTTGTLRIDGEPVQLSSITDAIKHGIAYVPEDRLSEGLFLSQSIKRNILATTLDSIGNKFFLDKIILTERATQTVDEIGIKTDNTDNAVNTLSGGNQQKVVLGKWLLTHAKILILNGPTVGVDIGSKSEIHKRIRNIAREGDLAVIMFSDDINELVHNCNRIIIMHKSKFVEEIPASDAEENDINNRLKELA
ncbi:sugar ABC transporter ATP-binding protein [Desulforhopalus sp. IMCC35007]|uniref:sugar ABC transporter ATP-binding protein n=1 Tax=Desulforhopalus sp. IMCC35007 TaxID=2569543 RepID=UPI0010AE7D19|nr:sugar ABC transporter ATP-binding protein [Desulforhopalus sp. IMCC35007]TKB07763.1 sugar ABC transporter ATP-binding protein [Desulforhopalus sp. IMCC35007]